MWLKVISVVVIYLFGNLLPALTTKHTTSVFQGKSDTLNWFKNDTIRLGSYSHKLTRLNDSTQLLFNNDGTVDTVRISILNP